MQQIQISEEALPILKAGIGFQKRLLSMKAENYLTRLKGFENKFSMESDKFLKNFEDGNLGDDADWYEWLFVYEAYKKAIQKKRILDGLSL
jgi:hypothetical protein